MEKLENSFLYLVVLGGRAKKANIELHDVRWVVGSEIKDTYETLRKDWFGTSRGLHIDSYKKIKYIDGYNKKYLWFVNIGGYNPTSMQEQHEFGLVIASNKLDAKNIAKSKWLIGCEKKHKDDIASLEIIVSYDDCKKIKKIGNWVIQLTLDEKFNEENNHPDWYGYQKIDEE